MNITWDYIPGQDVTQPHVCTRLSISVSGKTAHSPSV